MKRTRINEPAQLLVLLCAVSLLPWLARITRAQEPSPSPAPANQTIDKTELHQALLDLTNPWTVMCVAAHPDDEDGTTLTVLRRKYGVHTVSLFSTYGEGGQNAVGPELYEELGVIRARETMNAARIQGSEPYFLGLKDFGFSKSADEAFRVWGHDEALRRMVLKIRELRPDVIITNHDTTSGHGHHQATGRLIIEAFDAAADPKRFPEQMNGLKPWQAQRLFVRIFSPGSPDNNVAAPEKVLAIDPNEVDPVRGTSFAEQALEALQQHATQGPWPKTIAELLRARRLEAGKLPLIRYSLLREASNAPPLPEGAATFLGGLKAPQPSFYPSLPLTIDGRPLTEFLDKPDRVLDALISWRTSNFGAQRASDDPQRARLMESRFNRAIVVVSGVSLTLESRDSVLVPGMSTTFSISLANAGNRTVRLSELRLNSGGENVRMKAADQLLPDTETSVTAELTTPKNASFTVPTENHLYDGLFLSKRFDATAEMEIDGAHFSLNKQVNVDVAPAIEIKNVSPSPCVRTNKTLDRCSLFDVTVINHLTGSFRGVATSQDSHFAWISDEITFEPLATSHVTVWNKSPVPPREDIWRLMRSGSVLISINRVNPRESITQRRVPDVYSDARISNGLRVGFVPSFDDTLERSLAALGVESKALTVNDIQGADLSVYKTIIIDNRGYEAHPELIAANSHLLDFVREGGTLIVFYHKPNEWNPDEKQNRPQLAPYPIVVGDERVTDELAPIKFLQPRHLLLNFPNRIRPADFKDWIQERGLNYPKEWDPHFSALFSTNDPGEAPLRGGLLVASYGKGNYIYTSMVWYRELRAGVPGAYRMFANMISYGHR